MGSDSSPPGSWFDADRFTLVLSDGARLVYGQNGWGHVLEVTHVETCSVRWPLSEEEARGWGALIQASSYAGVWGLPADEAPRAELERRVKDFLSRCEAP